MTGDVYWYVVVISAYYSFIVGPICKYYLFSSILNRWCYVSLIVIIIEITVFLNVMYIVEIHCSCTAVLVFTLYYKEFLTEILITNFLTVV